VTVGKKYTYQVRVYISVLGWSAKSNEASATPGPKVTVSIDGWNTSAAAATKTVNVKSNTAWTVTFSHYTTTDKTWISVSKKNGAGDSSFKITVKANTSTNQRIASIKVEAKNDFAGSTAFTFQVIQAGKPAPKSTSTTSTSKPPTTTTASAAPPTDTTTTEDDPPIEATPIDTTASIEITAMPTDTPTDEPEPPPVGGSDIPWTVLIWAVAAVLIALIAAGVVIFIVRSNKRQ